MVDYIADYMESIGERRVYPDVQPGFLRHTLPQEAPTCPEPWKSIMLHFQEYILPGVAHSQSPHMHAYSAIHSPAALLGDMLASALNCLTFTWDSSPACTELDAVVTNWLARMLGLPPQFLSSGERPTGGGMFQNTSSEAMLVTLLSARERAALLLALQPADRERLVAYCSDQAHQSVAKGCRICRVQLHVIPSDQHFSLRGHQLRDAIAADKRNGLVPFYVCATLGTTFACSFDNLSELGPICTEEGMWLHVDAAYAGTAFVCPELRHWLAGVEHADSFTFLPCKIMLTNFYSCVLWVKDISAIEKTLRLEQAYSNNKGSGLKPELMHRQLSLTRHFHSLKVWFMIKNTGVEGIQSYVRQSIRLCQLLVEWVHTDTRFEMCAPSHLGMVVFRLCGDNLLTERLLSQLNSAGRTYCGLATLRHNSAIRFFIASQNTTEVDIWQDWTEIQRAATHVLEQ